jgi:hypothetical protein
MPCKVSCIFQVGRYAWVDLPVGSPACSAYIEDEHGVDDCIVLEAAQQPRTFHVGLSINHASF